MAEEKAELRVRELQRVKRDQAGDTTAGADGGKVLAWIDQDVAQARFVA